MTATAARSTRQKKTEAGKGLKIERVFTTKGVHPYDEVEWDRRDVVQTNWKTGETVFEQKGVEFPTSWSVNASTIVTTKYFRGALGSEQREASLKTLIDRVVKTYSKAGREFGYFSTDEDAEIFEHEITWMLLNQYFSFNSPVWFNVGTPSPPPGTVGSDRVVTPSTNGSSTVKPAPLSVTTITRSCPSRSRSSSTAGPALSVAAFSAAASMASPSSCKNDGLTAPSEAA